MNMNMCTCLTGRWNADVILRLQQLLQLQAWSNVCRCSAKSLKEKTSLFCHSRIGSSPRSSRPFISTFSLNPKPLKRFCKCIFGISQPRKRNLFLFFPPATLKSDPAGTGQHFLPRCPEDPHHFQIFISYVPDLRRSSFGITNRSEKRTSNISRNGQILTLCLQPLAETLIPCPGIFSPCARVLVMCVPFHWLHHTIYDFPMCWRCWMQNEFRNNNRQTV